MSVTNLPRLSDAHTRHFVPLTGKTVSRDGIDGLALFTVQAQRFSTVLQAHAG